VVDCNYEMIDALMTHVKLL